MTLAAIGVVWCMTMGVCLNFFSLKFLLMWIKFVLYSIFQLFENGISFFFVVLYRDALLLGSS